MKKFFKEYGAVAIIVIVIAVLLLIVGSVKGLDEGTGKGNNRFYIMSLSDIDSNTHTWYAGANLNIKKYNYSNKRLKGGY